MLPYARLLQIYGAAARGVKEESKQQAFWVWQLQGSAFRTPSASFQDYLVGIGLEPVISSKDLPPDYDKQGLAAYGLRRSADILARLRGKA